MAARAFREPMTQAELDAIQADAADNLRQLYAHERRLRRDMDDPECLSELTAIWAQIRQAEAELGPAYVHART